MAHIRRLRRRLDIWPGFVDALATLVMVIVFVLLVFVLAQYFLANALKGRQQALETLGGEMRSLGEQLSLERAASRAVAAERDRLAARAAALGLQLDSTAGQLEAERRHSDEARVQAASLRSQVEATRQELARLASLLEAAQQINAAQKVEIAELGQRLNVALATKVAELQRFRSEFFGRLRQVLGNRPGIRIEGDRFVFQSELLFDTGSAEMGKDGTAQVRRLAATLKDLQKKIPKDINWVLRVDGHTDRRPIASDRYPSNWELSTARAITVVRVLSAAGIHADRLAAAGFGEFQPLDPAESEAAYARNRRIELRLDQR
ncbi:MAG: peptidoglycan -binding protein [Magnetospirillum sp.]|nr:peptidoglycan -binding protein [Magnetospirillum sp.]